MVDEKTLGKIKCNALNAKAMNKEYIDKITVAVIRYHEDGDRKARLQRGLCKSCFYVRTSRVGGTAMTNRVCDMCGIVMNFSNTCTDCFCLECAVKHKYCKHCGQKQN